MVLVQSAPQSLLSKVHPNPARIFGIAGAIALNIALLMALLVPMQTPPPLPPREEPIGWQWFDPVKPPPIPPIVDVVPPRPTPQANPQPRVVQPTADPPPVVVDQGGPVDLPIVPPVQGTATASDVAADSGPLAGVRLEYAFAPPPKYTAVLMREQAQGTVLLQVLVDIDGKPIEVVVHKSSGNKRLDRLAQQHVLQNWTFRPAMKDGRAIQAIGLVPIDFKLQ